MRAESKKPTEAAFVAAFRAAHKRREPDTCKELFEHRMEVGLLPQEYAYVKVSAVVYACFSQRGGLGLSAPGTKARVEPIRSWVSATLRVVQGGGVRRPPSPGMFKTQKWKPMEVGLPPQGYVYVTVSAALRTRREGGQVSLSPLVQNQC